MQHIAMNRPDGGTPGTWMAMGRRLLFPLLLLALLGSLPSSVHATTAEAEVLGKAVTDISKVAADLNAGTLTTQQAAAAAIVIRDRDIGRVGDYSAACVPLAVYVRTSAEMFALALTMAALAEFGMASGYAMVVSALFLYPTHPTNRLADALQACATGL